ncbi:MAG: cellulase family glycosylhydrolase [Mobilitalea sp.]
MDYLKAVGTDIYAGSERILLRGFGLNGWFLPEGYMWKLFNKCDRPRKMEAMIETLCGAEYADKFWTAFLDHYITVRDIEFIAKEGYNSVRLPINARHLYEKDNGQLILKPEMFERIDKLIEWCRKYQVYVILDMHGAPGGQTGQNIDDSEEDQPALFLDKQNEEELIYLWRELVKRYKDEVVVAGYDLLNEPLPEFFSQYNDQLLPLYRRLIKEIREIDKKHMIILEGVHWATDFSIFDTFMKEEAADNIMLQFHKYWSNPDVESISKFIKCAKNLNVPLFMGEGGENNCDWYTTAFPLYESLNISWSFWSYKKMDCDNSPITFEVPKGWDKLIQWIDGAINMTRDEAIEIFNEFLYCIKNGKVNQNVLHSLTRTAPVRIPCEAYQEYSIKSERIPGANLRISEPVSLIFANGRTGDVDYRRLAGEQQTEENKVLVQLFAGDGVNYLINSSSYSMKVIIAADGDGEIKVSLDSQEISVTVQGQYNYEVSITTNPDKHNYLWITCTSGSVKLDNLYLLK